MSLTRQTLLSLAGCSIIAWLAITPVQAAPFFNGAATWNVSINTDAQMAVSFGGVPVGAAVKMLLTGTANVVYSNATANDVDISVTALNVSGTVQFNNNPSLTFNAIGMLLPGAAASTGHMHTDSGSFPASSFFDVFMEVDIANIPSASNPLKVYTGRNFSHGGPSNIALHEKTNVSNAFGAGTYSLNLTEIPGGSVDWTQQVNGNGVTYFSPTVGSMWTITIPPSAPTLVSAKSSKTHNLAGAFDIPLPLSGLAAIEPRDGGPTAVVLQFSEPVQGSSGPLSCTNVSLSSGSCATVTGDGTYLVTVNMSGATPNTCLTLAMNNVVDVTDNLPLSGDNDVQARVLNGDQSADGLVNIADLNNVKNALAQPVTGINFLMDITADGLINIADLNSTKNNLAASLAGCP